MDEETYERFMEKADRLEQSAETHRNVVSNIKSLKDDSGNYTPDSDNRLHLNNERYFFYHPAMLWDIKERGEMNIDDKWRVISGLAFKGDELCERMMSYFASMDSLSRGKQIVNHTKIAERLLTRTMKDDEYEGYLSGELPISGQKKDVHYLPQTQAIAS